MERGGLGLHGCAAAFAVLATGCGGDTVVNAAWPTLLEHELAFLLEVKARVRSPILGPFPATGPESRVQFTDSDDLHLISVDTRSLAALHQRVDPNRWDELRLVERPEFCSECDSVCRGDSNLRLYFPLHGVGRIFHLEDGEFRELGAHPYASLWLELPASWGCVDLSGHPPFERVGRWPAVEKPTSLERVAGTQLLVTGPELRVVGSPDLVMHAPPGFEFRNAVGLSPERVYVVAKFLDDELTDALHELALGPDRLELKRVVPVPVKAGGMHLDEMGLVIAGSRGEIVTSTDGVSFRSSVIAQSPSGHALARLGEPEAPFLNGSRSGGVFRGDPWAPGTPWTGENVGTDVGSTVGQFGETRSGDDRVVWARTFERGLFVQRRGQPWERPSVEAPRETSGCRASPNACGFSEPPQRIAPFAAREHTMFAAPDSCPTLLAMRFDLGCMSSFELRHEEGLVTDPLGVQVRDDFVYVLIPDGVLRASIGDLF